MILLKGYEHMVDFFTSFDWWKTEPHDELVNNWSLVSGQARRNLRCVSASGRQSDGPELTDDVGIRPHRLR